jgi:hypothetical protein
VSPSGFYASRTRRVSQPAQEDRRLKVLIEASFAAGRGYYWSPRVQDDLVEWGERVSRKRTIRLMQEDGLQARVRKRYKVTTDSDHDQPIAANVLERQFDAERPNQRWAGDTSEFVVGESGRLYLAVILDLFSRFVVGWAVSAVNDRQPHAHPRDGVAVAVLGPSHLGRGSSRASTIVGRQAFLVYAKDRHDSVGASAAGNGGGARGVAERRRTILFLERPMSADERGENLGADVPAVVRAGQGQERNRSPVPRHVRSGAVVEGSANRAAVGFAWALVAQDH